VEDGVHAAVAFVRPRAGLYAEKAQLEVNPVSGEELQKLVADIYKTPPEVAKQAAALLAVK